MLFSSITTRLSVGLLFAGLASTASHAAQNQTVANASVSMRGAQAAHSAVDANATLHPALALPAKVAVEHSNSSDAVQSAPKVEANISRHDAVNASQLALASMHNATQMVHYAAHANLSSEPVEQNGTHLPSQGKDVPNFMMHGEEPQIGATDTCQCEFHATCSCTASIQFLDCVSEACASGDCDCDDTQYKSACEQMAEQCPDLTFQCNADKSVCMSKVVSTNNATESVSTAKQPTQQGEGPSKVWATGHDWEGKPLNGYGAAVGNGTLNDTEPVSRLSEEEIANKTKELTIVAVMKQLEYLKEQKCQLQLSHRDGWVNADNQLVQVNAMIAARIDSLTYMGSKLPEMHCEKDFEEWHDNPTATPPPVQSAAVINTLPSLLVVLASILALSLM